jgi:hypothetical protein
LVLFGLLGCALLGPMTLAVEPESDTGIQGTIRVGPVHGGPSRAGVPDFKALANAAFAVTSGGGGELASFTTDAEGRFYVSLPPGRYVVSMKEKKPKIGHFGPFAATVVEGKITNVEWMCDTGMR